MNICLVNNLFPPINTGSSFYTNDLAIHLAKKGHKVVVVTNLVEGTKMFELQDEVRIYRLPAIKLPRLKLWMRFSDFSFTLTYKNLKKFKKILIEEKIDIIHQCNTIFDLVFASSFFANRLKIPLICSVTTQIQHLNPFYNKLLDLFDRFIIYLLFSKRVFHYIALDKETERYLNVRYNLYENTSIVPYSIPTENNLKSLTEYKRDYSKTNYRMVSLGHISELKDREEMIRAWTFVVKKYPKAKLIIIGDLFSKKSGKLIKRLNLKKNVILTGRIDHKDIHKYLQDVDFGGLFFSSRLPFCKGIGTANLELIASGLPVIADADDDFFGDKFPIKANQHFIKAESRDPEWLAEKFIELFENPRMRENIGKQGQQFIKKFLTWDRIIAAVEEVYEIALARRK